MLKNIARLESVVGSRVGHLLVDADVPVQIAMEMCKQFMAYLQSVEDAAKAQQASQEASPCCAESEPKPAE